MDVSRLSLIDVDIVSLPLMSLSQSTECDVLSLMTSLSHSTDCDILRCVMAISVCRRYRCVIVVADIVFRSPPIARYIVALAVVDIVVSVH